MPFVSWSPDPDALRGRVAVVAGATRGAGRGIAAALGEAGATVVCTGRSTRSAGSARSDYDRAETIEETAELVTSLGGTGIAEVVDHLDSEQVGRLADRLQTDFGHIDVLVNDIWGAELLKGVGDAGLGARSPERVADPPARDRHPPHHLPPLAPAGHRPPRRPARRGDRRDGPLQRIALPAERLLRPGQGGGEPAGMVAGPRGRALRRHRRGRHPRLAALGER